MNLSCVVARRVIKNIRLAEDIPTSPGFHRKGRFAAYSQRILLRTMSSDFEHTAGSDDNNTKADDLSNLSHTELVQRVASLEARLKSTTAQLTALTTTARSQYTSAIDGSEAAEPSLTLSGGSLNDPVSVTAAATTKPEKVAAVAIAGKVKVKKQSKPFDPSQYSTRHIALKFSYIGRPYNGYEHSNNSTSAPQKPTIEEVLWKALRKTRLINPTIPEGADQSYDVVWDERERAQRYGVGTEGFGRGKRGKERLELVWDGLAYSKCGRTDKGVSAFGQVIGITVRSNRPTKNKKKGTVTTKRQPEAKSEAVIDDIKVASAVTWSEADQIRNDGTGKEENNVDEEEDGDDPAAEWDSIRDELPYISVLNGILPPTIRILAWCPHPPSGFDARFSCQERRYKYLFTNPAICPTPGSLGLKTASGKHTTLRDGWLDIDAMRKAAKKLEGVHDYRNLCKIDSSKQMSNCQRRITFTDVEEFHSGIDVFVNDPRLRSSELVSGSTSIAKQVLNNVIGNKGTTNEQGPKVYTFSVHGTAFLWHQVRCMVAILFLVGQKLEEPEIIDRLLDITHTPGKPHYDMADDAPLVLWDCVFPGDESPEEDGMEWIYAGDHLTVSSLSKTDGKFGNSGLVDHLWTQWREAKLQETVTSGLLGLVLGQGDGTALERGGVPDPSIVTTRGQRVFDGSSSPRLAGDYVSVMQRPQMESLEVQNAKYAAGKKARRDLKKGSTGPE